ncbi:MAG: hypothetical protein Q9214_005306 [Letrouitia sp. 1 TL-2023]
MPEHVPAAQSTESEEVDVSSLFWNINISPKRWTRERPPYLANMSEKDKGKNRLERFQRVPSDLRRYLKFIYDLKKQYGSILSFIQYERLHWHDTIPSGDSPFANSSDYKILCNDWPYALEPSIVHLVVWLKFELESDETTDYLTPSGRQEIEDFVNRVFCEEGGISREQVIWFKNGPTLKSVHALEHIHVLLYQAPTEMVERLTEGDKPMSTIRAEEEAAETDGVCE